MMQDADVVAPVRERLCQRPGIVGAAIVHDHHLPAVHLLEPVKVVAECREVRGEDLGFVVHRDYDRHAGPIVGAISASSSAGRRSLGGAADRLASAWMFLIVSSPRQCRRSAGAGGRRGSWKKRGSTSRSFRSPST